MLSLRVTPAAEIIATMTAGVGPGGATTAVAGSGSERPALTRTSGGGPLRLTESGAWKDDAQSGARGNTRALRLHAAAALGFVGAHQSGILFREWPRSYKARAQIKSVGRWRIRRKKLPTAAALTAATSTAAALTAATETAETL